MTAIHVYKLITEKICLKQKNLLTNHTTTDSITRSLKSEEMGIRPLQNTLYCFFKMKNLFFLIKRNYTYIMFIKIYDSYGEPGIRKPQKF